ncbi:hypothetical protein RHSIM_Rhsim02G0025500 [Rhododendron simsii]|uniref:Transcription repressor n=1 Tax=Rhododendron simsii TaxID=118357 RepID=A0A834LX26_RHOSS|nr:hypothetical protein RHSIM_Rhsim02G0025500 [Rhododendron simsii]
MSNILWKHFYLCLSKLKCFPTCLPPPLPSQQQDDTTLQPPTPLAKTFNNPLPNTAAAASDLSATSSFFSDSSDSSSDNTDPHLSIPDFAALFASHRFFFPSPGHSNSIVVPDPDHNPDPLVAGGVAIDTESPDLDPDPNPLVAGGVAVDTDSPDPYWDFRRSMQEMVDARQLFDVKADWDYLHELLLCYLSLNPKHTHEFIFGAFSDLLVSLVSSNSTGSCRREPESHRSAAVSRQL